MNEKKKVEFLIVDTSAFINKAAIQDIGENVLTVPHVVDEIKSKRQLRRLVVLPYDLTVKDPFPENIKFVTDFAKKTGDFASLSATDINVIALTYQLEKEKNGASHLNSAPVCRPTIQPTSAIPDDLKKIAGFYVPKKGCKSRSDSLKTDEDVSEYDSAEDEEYNSAEDDEINLIMEKISFNNEKPDTESGNPTSDEKENQEEPINSESEENVIAKEVNEEEEETSEDEEDSQDDGDDINWITPTNLQRAKNQVASELAADFENIRVACLTTDFAMQNVLKQIGLHVISLDGKLIKQLRTFILRCYGCFKTTSIMTKVFCPNCGNKTLKKVGVSVDENGRQRLHINFRRPLTARGKRYSLPKFKGGKHSNNPIICEDQPMPQQRPSRLSRTKNNPLNDDYIAGYSPFVTRDVTSKSAMLGIKPHLEMKHWMRKNPNESRRKKK